MPSQYSHNTDDLTPVDALPGWKKTLGGVLALGMDLLNVRIPRHSDTQPTLIRTPVPRSFGQAV
ncbi:hypothetical protein L4442_00905, partial [Pseudomonas aeruginosa]|nr:hypothetical protein [Pseudomonas aeruginosa]